MYPFIVSIYMFSNKDKEVDESSSSKSNQKITGSELVRLMMGRTKYEQKEADISISTSKRNQFSYDQYSLSCDVTQLSTLKEKEIKEQNDSFTSNVEEDDDENDDDDNDDYCDGFVNKEYLNTKPCLKVNTLHHRRLRESRHSEPILIPISRSKRTATLAQGSPVITDSPVEHHKRRLRPSSTGVTRMNAFRRTKLSSCMSMELLPSTQVRLVSFV